MSDLPAELIAASTYRRHGLKVWDELRPAHTALLILNMQNAWLASGAPFESADARATLPAITRLAGALRQGGCTVGWFQMTTGAPGTADYWTTYFDNFVGPDKRGPAAAALLAGSAMHALYPQDPVMPGDLVLPKYRFSAFAHNPHDLDALLRARSIDTVIVAGTATNVCCESTIRDAMMRDFRTFMPHDAVSAPRPDGHRAGLRSVMQAFADVRGTDELIALMR